mmetsp:Transcript_73984/g.154233  ORF Transcript_73984/g.154233 Transcript_73984/m.154233 type:complete len:267 (+) Transcript_73984:90-890(+)|eukprot:CAMPEP_0194747768 /NCGR_PEP_ID=MMETSP0323_2-20130528/1936_1 /TAXON_ID=2866 ORGANISM="Crypthecodinium cohnii, Strain Seligo" /NCGR_SAMPLE_ID=MMETSP0323_2 /ASSEMBLY_ACC=CAM_ASM_000346 /LENGTH=266 /DNA_ID=CAMNT_0039661477 /DNA_START=21 /DNA_END=821 /DNA_ORIENTATION=-
MFAELAGRLNPWRHLSQVTPGEFSWVGKVAVGMFACIPAYFTWEFLDNQQKQKRYQRMIGDKVFMDIGIGNQYAGRILIGLYSDRVPLTCENFVQLCKGYQLKDKVIGYRNTLIHMIKPGGCISGGDVLAGTGRTHGISIYGEAFPDENFDMEFLRDGDLAMVNWGKNTNSSVWMITLSHQPMYYGHHVVFGTVLKGMKLVREIGELGTKVGRPAIPVRILQCGVYEEGKEEPALPEGFSNVGGPLLTEDEFKALNHERPGTNQPS